MISHSVVFGLVAAGLTFGAFDQVAVGQACPGVTDQSQLRGMEPVPDGAGKVFPLVVIHGITGSADAFDQTVNRSMVGAHPKPDRSMLDMLVGVKNQPGIAGVPHTRVYSFEYTADSLRWFTESANGADPVGERFASVIDCLSAQHGTPVMVLAHSMGGLVTRWAANQTLGSDGQPKIGKVVTLGTPYRGSSMATTLVGDAVDGLALTSPALSAIVLWCGWRGTNTGNSTSVDCDLFSSLTSQAGRALRLGSPELAALAPWPQSVDVTALAGSIFVEGTLFGARTPRQEIGDAVVGLDSATANGDENIVETCDPFADESPLWIRVIKSISLQDDYPKRIDQLVRLILGLPCYHGGLMASVKQNIEVLGEFNDWIGVNSVAPLSNDACEGLDGSLAFDGPDRILRSVCAGGWALVESTDCCIEGKARSIVDLIQFNAQTTNASGQVRVAGWLNIQNGPAVSGYTVQSIVDKGVPEPIAQLLFESLDACSGCRPSPWNFGEFFEIPQLGSEPVRGSGCNISSEIVPDGWWYGRYAGVVGGSINFDVECVYLGAKARELHENCKSASKIGVYCWNPDAFPVNANTRTRSIPVSNNFFSEKVFSDEYNERCDINQPSSWNPLEAPPFYEYERFAPTWILVQQGQLVYSRYECGFD